MVIGWQAVEKHDTTWKQYLSNKVNTGGISYMRWWHLLLQSGHGFEESRISTDKQSANTCTMESS